MRRTCCSWVATLARLGFKKSSGRLDSFGTRRKISGYARRLAAEEFEDRRMLSASFALNDFFVVAQAFSQDGDEISYGNGITPVAYANSGVANATSKVGPTMWNLSVHCLRGCP